MTSHIIVQAKGKNSTIKLVETGTVVQGEYESWILNTGKRIMFVHNSLHKKLKAFHLLGSFQNGALYGFTYEETCALMREFLGRSDKDEYEFVKAQSRALGGSNVGAERIAVAGTGALHIVTKVLLLTVKFVLTMMLVPFIIKLLSKRK